MNNFTGQTLGMNNNFQDELLENDMLNNQTRITSPGNENTSLFTRCNQGIFRNLGKVSCI